MLARRTVSVSLNLQLSHQDYPGSDPLRLLLHLIAPFASILCSYDSKTLQSDHREYEETVCRGSCFAVSGKLDVG